MDRSYNNFRLILKLISSIVLILFTFGVMIAAAAMIGWQMVLGIGIVIALELYRRTKYED